MLPGLLAAALPYAAVAETSAGVWATRAEQPSEGAQCDVPIPTRADCFPGAGTELECVSKGCCWCDPIPQCAGTNVSTTPGRPVCFFPAGHGPTPPPPGPPPASAVTLMPLGDSITFGCGDQCAHDCTRDPPTEFCPCSPCAGGYRTLLHDKLAAAGKPTTFVGLQSNGGTNHSGFPGWTTQGLLNILPKWAALRPDVITLHIGTNNIGNDQFCNGTITGLKDLLAGISKSLPDTEVFVASIIPMPHTVIYYHVPPTYNLTEYEVCYNEAIPGVVQAAGSKGEPGNTATRTLAPFHFVDMNGLGHWDYSTDYCPPHLHPKDSGCAYQKMSTIFFDAVKGLAL
eukprot:gene9413-1693_t